MFQKKPSASEVDDVQYRRAKTWQIICYACNAFVGMSVYSLIGMASYSASIGYGITTATVGIILMLARILDAFTDPMLAFVYDRVNTRFGKLRVLLISGYLIEAVGLLCMFNLCSSKGFGLPVFVLTYIIYIIGYTVSNMTIQTLPAIMTNDPRQRPTIGVWTTALNYFVPMGMSMLVYTVILPKCGGTFNQGFLSTVCTIVLIIAGIGTLIVCAGISAYDKPENFEGISKNHEPLKVADILEVFKHNKPLQCYVASHASDKLAQQVGSQAIINTMLNGILIGNMGLATTLSMISMVPSIFFAAFGAKYVGKKGSKKGIVTWTCVSMAITSVLILFFIFTDTRQIGVIGSWNMINPFNGKSRAAEISKVLDSYIPNVARMKDQLRKYNVAFTKTAAENEKLKEKNKTLSASLDKAKEGSVLKRLEDAKLRQDYEAALKTLDSIPPEVIRFYENRTQEPAMRHDK